MKFTQIKETCIYVSDLERTREFYEGQLGLECIGMEKNRHVFFSAGSSVLLCFISDSTMLLSESGLPPHGAKGIMHFALEVESSSFTQAEQELRNKGIIIEHQQQWKNGFKSVYFRDPDRHLVEIIPKGLWK